MSKIEKIFFSVNLNLAFIFSAPFLKQISKFAYYTIEYTNRDSRGCDHDRMEVEFTTCTTYAICTYQH